jgi:hypothetical protein
MPSLKGMRPTPRFRMPPISKDPTNPGVDDYISKLIRQGTVGTTWPQIHPHGHLLLTERLNAAAKKCPWEVHAGQPPGSNR